MFHYTKVIFAKKPNFQYLGNYLQVFWNYWSFFTSLFHILVEDFRVKSVMNFAAPKQQKMKQNPTNWFS